MTKLFLKPLDKKTLMIQIEGVNIVYFAYDSLMIFKCNVLSQWFDSKLFLLEPVYSSFTLVRMHCVHLPHYLFLWKLAQA